MKGIKLSQHQIYCRNAVYQEAIDHLTMSIYDNLMEEYEGNAVKSEIESLQRKFTKKYGEGEEYNHD